MVDRAANREAFAPERPSEVNWLANREAFIPNLSSEVAWVADKEAFTPEFSPEADQKGGLHFRVPSRNGQLALLCSLPHGFKNDVILLSVGKRSSLHLQVLRMMSLCFMIVVRRSSLHLQASKMASPHFLTAGKRSSLCIQALTMTSLPCLLTLGGYYYLTS